MKSIFLQTAEHRTKKPPNSDYLINLPEVIRIYTDWDYTCYQTDTGYFLMPTFRNMPFRNSFVPEIDITVSHNDMQTCLYMRGQPVKSVRIFMAIWFSLLFIAEINFLAFAIASKLDGLFPVFIPIIMCAFGYLLCQISTKIIFACVVKAIRKEFL